MYIFGVFVVIFGLAFLLRNLGILYFPGSFWSLFYPIVIIGLGVAVVCITHEGRKLLKKIREWLNWSSGVK
ncbi:MAG: hypothetical protein A3B86_02915 [Candidatus Yanofskybacteria bacterium RIFCSPHIGHO2_02_FULL_38_22b]|uniref:LiaI-LiaF-like transmembrane region domain-containing protein n=1 Tax=Candidatus Yanofskybacteria bacterium RIFCSPHIGHO2_02_FULL_38_22b TaxID=1802673 RepID=A0A1F8F126_9BACT|nr:MAG: hypothetical protein A2816_02505 [Candidatus Yanofskybacteria bacterium RIFCSPHIGHO2_01_FULL_39_44]OGN06823.1 MAG: hypothetical protein A3B86_02915 [Candidatus Yanofskybacteria bacterium RIFCSPHIGHO2_02_FULL_38_22b]OGN20718.1 MAG: hypothetical protein A2910_00875 [Candidatus Yanofskybacteria bacterium RIFCSPLOWO2_01_FULL_39_28]